MTLLLYNKEQWREHVREPGTLYKKVRRLRVGCDPTPQVKLADTRICVWGGQGEVYRSVLEVCKFICKYLQSHVLYSYISIKVSHK